MLVRSLGLFTVGCAIGVAWGLFVDATWAGLMVGLTAGAGLALSRGLPGPRRPGFLSLPSWNGALGAVLLALAFGGALRPALIFDPSWALGALDTVADGDGFELLTDAPAPKEDEVIAAFLPAFRAALARDVLGAALADDERTALVERVRGCPVTVVVVRSPERAQRLARFGAAEFGFASHTLLRGHVVVARGGSGLGTLAHLLTTGYVACGFPAGLPPWAAVGTAAFTEKLMGFVHPDGPTFSWGYRSDWRDRDLDGYVDEVDLVRELVLARDQNVLRAFMVYLHHQGWLGPLLAELSRDPDDDVGALQRATGRSIVEVEAHWKAWRRTESGAVPELTGSFFAREPDAARVEQDLRRRFTWDDRARLFRGGSIPMPAIPGP